MTNVPPLCGLSNWKSVINSFVPGLSMLNSHNEVTSYLNTKLLGFGTFFCDVPCCLPCNAVSNSKGLNRRTKNKTEKVSVFTQCIGFFAFPFLIAQNEKRVNKFKESTAKQLQTQQQTYDAPRQQMLLRV